MSFKSKEKGKINPENLFFNAKLAPVKAKRIFTVMDFLGIDNRAVVTAWALTEWAEKYGKPLN